MLFGMECGMQNAEMTMVIGEEKAKLFATAHEDKGVTGNESDGYSKVAHRDMDIHNNEVGRNIGQNNIACKLRSNGMPVPLLRNGYSIFNGTKYR